ncbi:MAG: prepilin-type N-terminal cleavage/methylation domain-containing protein [Proteobacteria bacterium]|nr:prepilin-type N-terminal cleavage/methylation domain-containing protein [Pseudomonadota bacterium]MBU1419788.1 prepilin-type N-terminal cleavage/methylation domain-containing protein [Pseudomonadota bacterium]MBU1456756.1 prepilin-type N-terminal cleavage/methylation domain-containing protein [Pseudomonadota bacterium]
MHSPFTRQGFTLLELLIVCFLISISLALAVPAIRNTLVTDQLATGSRKVISLIKSARSKAVMTQQPYLIFLDPAEQRLWYQEATGEEGIRGEESSSVIHPSITLPSGIRILDIKQESGDKEQNPVQNGLWISKQGYMDKTAIHLGDGSNRTISLLISPFLHTIQVLDGPVYFE